MKVFAVFTVFCLAMATASNFYMEAHWMDFKVKHTKVYKNSAEEVYRKAIFADNLDFILKHNNEAAKGMHSFTVGVNEFCDMTSEEFNAFYNGYKAPEVTTGPMHQHSGKSLSNVVDWRTQGYVTDVHNQASCGSCWAFAAVGGLEGQWYKAHGQLIHLSEQELVDCEPQSYGCSGGYMTAAYSYANSHGMERSTSYPYTAQDGSCKYNSASVVVTSSSYRNVGRSEASLRDAVGSVGPVSVAIDAGQRTFQTYSAGTYYDPNCSTSRLNHAVLAVGYGTSDSQNQHDYWIVKNSWGTSWGMSGYINMARDMGNHCGISNQGSYPVI